MNLVGWLVTGLLVAFVVGAIFLEIRGRRTDHLPESDVKVRESDRDRQKGEWGGF